MNSLFGAPCLFRGSPSSTSSNPSFLYNQPSLPLSKTTNRKNVLLLEEISSLFAQLFLIINVIDSIPHPIHNFDAESPDQVSIQLLWLSAALSVARAT
jgi:hypothetical protein